ncbi:unnamed protein product [Spodoptera exigua]|nr:unnamed protein product [Spodoptera exigua]
MDKRQEELTKLKSYTEIIDNDLTMILQSLQWDRKQLLQNPMMDTCRYDPNHKIPPDKREEHEKVCFLRKNGYFKEDQLLPDPLDANSNTLVKLRKEDIQDIIANASRADITFKKGLGCHGAEPMSLERLQVSYSADERRVIHDAVVSAVPSCHDLTDLALLSENNEQGSKVILTRKEILLELRNMRRRRTKYRVAPKTRNYSDVLRDVIKTQMEVYNDGKTEETTTNETVDRMNSCRDINNGSQYSGTDSYNGNRNRHHSQNDDRIRYTSHNVDRDSCDSRIVDRNESKKWVPRPIQVKSEREEYVERDRIVNKRRPRQDSNDIERYQKDRKKWVPRPIQEEIKTEREDFTDWDAETDKTEHSRRYSKYEARHRHERPKKWVPRPIKTEVKTEKEGSRERDRNSENRHSKRVSESLDENRYTHNEETVPKPIKEIIKTEREDSTERFRSVERRYSSQDFDSVPRPIKVEVKTERDETERITESTKKQRDEINSIDERDRSGRQGHNHRERRYYEENDQGKYGEYSRKRKDGCDYEEYIYNRDKTKERRQNYYDDREHRTERRHKRSHRHDDHVVESKKRKESRLDDESHGHDRKHEEKRDDKHKDKDRRRTDKHKSRHYGDSGSRHREKTQDYRQEAGDRIQIKQERADSVTSRDNHENCDDELYRDRTGHRRYYDDSNVQDEYDPYKKIKTEK